MFLLPKKPLFAQANSDSPHLSPSLLFREGLKKMSAQRFQSAPWGRHASFALMVVFAQAGMTRSHRKETLELYNSSFTLILLYWRSLSNSCRGDGAQCFAPLCLRDPSLTRGSWLFRTLLPGAQMWLGAQALIMSLWSQILTKRLA